MSRLLVIPPGFMENQMLRRLFSVKKTGFALLFVLQSSVCFSQFATAGMVIDAETRGQRTQMMTNGQRARLDLPGDDGYLLADFQTGKVLMVTPKKRQIIDLGNGDSATGNNAPRVELQPRGGGPQIAGFTTVQFSLSAEGQNCGVVYGSREAMQVRGMDSLFNALKGMIETQFDAMGSFSALLNVCTLASMDFASHADEIGLPMRMLDVNGKVLSEVNRINTNAEIPPGAFDIPSGYHVVSLYNSLAEQAIDTFLGSQREYTRKNYSPQVNTGYPARNENEARLRAQTIERRSPMPPAYPR